ncbi:hypothetical protein FRV13_00060 (plasmid) [Escherichia coli]|nr:hypothetical protein [Escherichia coli]EGO6591372.1 hypothetical protein [Escherichia coli]PJX95121.1 hypothetical protein CWM24_23880 [Escherichia coli]QEG84917.1 hypothetical protein FRV13_00060 [Escherichia coli]TGD19510.1 hypothetical protein DXT71_29415 [Escherichia coli]
MSHWRECGYAAESRRGEVASIFREMEQKTATYALYQSVSPRSIVVSFHMVYKECRRNIRFVMFF